MTSISLGGARDMEGTTGRFFGFRSWRAALLTGVGTAALMIGSSASLAGEYHVSDEAALRQTIQDIADGTINDPNPIIILDAPIAVSATPFPSLGQPLTINTNGNTLSGIDTPAGATPGASIVFAPGSGSLTVSGSLQGGDSAPNAGNVKGGTGLSGQGLTITNIGTITGGAGGGSLVGNLAAQGGIGLRLENGTLINNNLIEGGAGGISVGGNNGAQGAGGIGALLIGGTDHVNNGTIRGGIGPGGGAGPFTANADPVGLSLENASLVNNGTIEGGTPIGGSFNADGVYMRNSTIINSSSGVIKGGDQVDLVRPSDGITFVGAGNSTVINYGLISSGDFTGSQGGHAIIANVAGNYTVVNYGTISGRGSSSNDLAIRMNFGGTLALEIHGGSVIDGKVFATTGAAANDILRLAGDVDDSFDVSEIGVGAFSPGPEKYQNFNTFEKTGSGIWTITGTALNLATPSPWDIYEGTILMSAGSDLGNGTVDVIGGTLAGVGIVGPIVHHAAGTIAPGSDGIGTLTIDGVYTGNGGLLEVETVLGDDNSDTDLLDINGNTSGNTFVRVTNLGGGGAPTQEGIKIVNVDGADSSGSFNLLGDYLYEGEQAVVGGAYAYRLYQGSVTNPVDGDWYLRSELDDALLFQAGAPVYEAYGSVLLQSFASLETLQQRVGNRSWTLGVVDENGELVDGRGFWGRIIADYSSFSPDGSTTGASYDANTWRLQAGADGTIDQSEAGTLVGGLNIEVGTISADIGSIYGDGSISSLSFGGGATLTFYGSGGFYLDGQAQVKGFTSTLSSETAGLDLIEDNAGFGYGLSLEAGQKVALTDELSITPQAQLSYSSVRYDDFTDTFGAGVSLGDSDRLVGRLGLSVDHESKWVDEAGRSGRTHLYGIANLYHQFDTGSTAEIDGTVVAQESDPWWGGVGAGGSIDFEEGYSIYGEARANTSLTSFGDSYSLGATAGLRGKF